MKAEVFAVYDSCSKGFLSPWTAINTAQAVRAFLQTAKRVDSAFNQSPMDYVLFKLGIFDDTNAQFDLLPTPERIIGAWEAPATAPAPVEG